MNKCTFVLVSLLVGGLVAGSALAQAPAEKKPEAKPGAPAARPVVNRNEQRVESLAKRLKLDDEQKVKVKAIFDEESQKVTDIRAVPAAERGAKFKALRESTLSKLKEVFTPEQYETYTKMFSPPPGARTAPGAAPAAAPKPASPPPAK